MHQIYSSRFKMKTALFLSAYDRLKQATMSILEPAHKSLNGPSLYLERWNQNVK